MNFTGSGSFYFSYNDGTIDRSVTGITSNPYTLVVTPDQNRRYKLNNVGNSACGSTNSELPGSVRVVVDASTSDDFSLLKYRLPSPCPSVLSLYSTLLDINSGQTNTAKALQINATNKVGDGAMANCYGQNAVLLSPGFQTNLSTGGSFNASIQGCN